MIGKKKQERCEKSEGKPKASEVRKEQKEHPELGKRVAKQIAKDHAHERHEKAESPKTERREDKKAAKKRA